MADAGLSTLSNAEHHRAGWPVLVRHVGGCSVTAVSDAVIIGWDICMAARAIPCTISMLHPVAVLLVTRDGLAREWECVPTIRGTQQQLPARCHSIVTWRALHDVAESFHCELEGLC